ncbi:hypothetical protein [Nocardia sp. NPDC005366]|uniref:hypothetical protein n=1 Tax=Nocardia sp. NPDC005366 TaxID=3156878 RepID=UPI0033B2BAD1
MKSDTNTPVVEKDPLPEGETARAGDDSTEDAGETRSPRDLGGETADSPAKDESAEIGRASKRMVRLSSIARRDAVMALLIAIAVVSTVIAAVCGWKLKNGNDTDAAGRAAQRAAEQYALALTSIDSNNLDRDFATVLDGATGEFKDMYSQSSAQLKQLLIDNKATGHGTVVDSAVKSASDDRAEVLLFVDQTVTNTASPDPRVDRSRMLMTMERVDGRWLAAKVSLS